MGIMTTLKARKAASLQAKGDSQSAMRLYKEAVSEGLNTPRYLLSYSVLLLRNDEYQAARELLVKAQKAPGMTADQRTTLFVNYACSVFKLGDLQKGIDVLEKQHAKQPCGLIYETLGCLYIETGEYEKALSFNEEALDYDDEDSIVLDNLAQTHYRLGKDKAKAKEYFLKAHSLKPSQIDTLYFLALYDIDDGNVEAGKEKLENALDGRFSPLNYASKEKIQEVLDRL